MLLKDALQMLVWFMKYWKILIGKYYEISKI